MLFKLLDTDNMGKVPLDRFVMGCLRFRGGAKSLDLAVLSYKVEAMERDLHVSLLELKSVLGQEMGLQPLGKATPGSESPESGTMTGPLTTKPSSSSSSDCPEGSAQLVD